MSSSGNSSGSESNVKQHRRRKSVRRSSSSEGSDYRYKKTTNSSCEKKYRKKHYKEGSDSDKSYRRRSCTRSMSESSEAKKSIESSPRKSRSKSRSLSRERKRPRYSSDRLNYRRSSQWSHDRNRGRPWKKESFKRDHRSFTPPLLKKSPNKNQDLTPAERDARTVFCMQLSHKVREKDLINFFDPAGKVVDVRLITCTKTRKFKGIAYVEFDDPDAIPRALNLTGSKLLGVPVLVQLTQCEKNRIGIPNQSKALIKPMKLYINYLHNDVSDDLLRNIFEPFGLIDSIQIVPTHDEIPHKYGFINFHYGDDAQRALEQLNGIELVGVPMSLSLLCDDPLSSLRARVDTDDLDGTGIELGATGRLQLMLKLAEGTGLKIPVAATSALNVPATTGTSSIPPIETQCFMLCNMFDSKSKNNKGWDKEIKNDVIEECSKYGEVYHIYIDKESHGNVYVKCSSVDAAVKAVNALHGRYFAGKIVTAAYVPTTNYHNSFTESIKSKKPLKASKR